MTQAATIVAEGLFQKVSRSQEYMTPKKKAEDGIREFARKMFSPLGLIFSPFDPKPVVKSIDEMAQLLVETGMASSVKEGRNIAPNLVGGHIYLRGAFHDELKIAPVQNPSGKEAFRISYIKDCYDY